MSNGMVIVAVMSVVGLSGLGHAAQPEQKTGQDRVRAEYANAAKKCDGLGGEARKACLKDAQASSMNGKNKGASMPDRSAAPGGKK